MIVLTTAMKKEFDAIAALFKNETIHTRDFCRGSFKSAQDVALICTGTGKVNAAMSITKVLHTDAHIERVISLGCAGAAVPNLKVGDIVVGNSYCYHDVWCGKPNMPGQVQDWPTFFPSDFQRYVQGDYTIGTIASGDWFVQSREKMESIINYLPPTSNIVAVDMESAALAHVCYDYEVPFVSIRIISDNPLLPNQEVQYENFWQELPSKFTDILKDTL